MEVREYIPVVIEDKEGELEVLFNSGSTMTLMGEEILQAKFGKIKVKELPQEKVAYTLNGTEIRINSYIDVKMKICGTIIVTLVYISKDIKHKMITGGEEIKFPDIIIGSTTMEDWNITLDLERGKVKSCGGPTLVI